MDHDIISAVNNRLDCDWENTSFCVYHIIHKDKVLSNKTHIERYTDTGIQKDIITNTNTNKQIYAHKDIKQHL